jgi:cytochrome c oxidase assembly protein subunit 15
MLWVLYPNRATRITFASGKEYDKGQVIMGRSIISSDDLYRSHLSTRTTGKKYTKHDYAIFNQSILGLNTSIIGTWESLVITFILSFGYRKENKTNFTLTLICLMGFQAWLGKTVVDSV